MGKNKKRIIEVDYLARVEGEGALFVKLKGDKISEVKFKIFEPPRFFEAFLRGRHLSEAPDITARICGICPAAYQMSSVHAMENALGIVLPQQIRELRRLLYCGEWIESHTLHVYMLHAPDFLGYDDAIAMAKEHKGILERGLALKKAGNEIGRIIGGREIHPINVRVGGFYKLPDKKELKQLHELLLNARELAQQTVQWVATLPIPDFERDYEFVSLRHDSEYPFSQGRIVSNKGVDIPVSEYENNFEESHVKHSNALHSHKKGGGYYFVGPLARYNNNYDHLSRIAKDAATGAGLGPTCNNPFKSIIVRSIEVLYACDEALRIIEDYSEPENPYVEYTPRKSTGYGCTEAPRGILYHRYDIGDDGLITEAKIVPPTSQNQATIEEDLIELIPSYIHLSDNKLQWRCEQAIRNYDPCISCSAHFLKFNVERG